MPDPCHFQNFDRSMSLLRLVTRDALRGYARMKLDLALERVRNIFKVQGKILAPGFRQKLLNPSCASCTPPPLAKNTSQSNFVSPTRTQDLCHTVLHESIIHCRSFFTWVLFRNMTCKYRLTFEDMSCHAPHGPRTCHSWRIDRSSYAPKSRRQSP